MNGNPHNLWRKLACGLLLAATAGLLLMGCGGTPRQRYQTLSYFFDGVPNPDAPKNVKTEGGVTVPVIARVVKQHPPYRDNKCDICHHGPNGELQDFSLAYNACVKCHKTMSSEHKLMHGPVAREACKWCHTPHESAEPYLLKADAVTVCTQCHDKQLLGNKPPEHLDGKTSCLNCHAGHGGDARYFLKAATATMPTTPATAPGANDKLRAQRPVNFWFGWLPAVRTAQDPPMPPTPGPAPEIAAGKEQAP